MQQVKIEHISQPKTPYTLGEQPAAKMGKNIRLTLFVLTFLISIIVGLAINYSRPAVYLSNATLLTSAATAVDQSSREVDFQHVTIQKQKLLGVELLTEALSRVKSVENDLQLADLTLTDIRNMLNVEPIEDTNLLNMFATGPEPEVLPLVINTWIDVYLEVRALSVKNSADNTVGRVKDELIELDSKIEQARKEIDLFRKANDISSITREENELPATLISLTKAFNNANEEVLKTKAKLDAINQAIAKGEAVVPKQELTSLTELEREYRGLKEKLAEFDKNFTRDYLQFKGSMKHIPEQIEKLERQIKQKRAIGRGVVWTEVSQNYYAAKQVLDKVRRQLDQHKLKAANFTTLFSEHKKRVEDLEAMELLTRETQDRLLKIESKQFEKYPQVDVVERASINKQAVSPDYNLGLALAVFTSLLLAFFAVWFRGFLMQGQAPVEQDSYDLPMAAWLGERDQGKFSVQKTDDRYIKQQTVGELPQLAVNQQLTEAEVQKLLTQGDKNTQLVILLLLSGLAVDEISSLTLEQIKSEFAAIEVLGRSPRTLTVGRGLQERLDESLYRKRLWEQQESLSIEEINAMLYCSAIDIGLSDVEETLADALRNKYIIFLVEQGLRLTALSEVFGFQSAIELAAYASFSPEGEGVDIDQVQLIYPVCS